MKNSLLLIKGTNEPFRAVVTEAMQKAFPGATVATIHSLEQVPDAGQPGGAQILLLVEGGSAEAGKAKAILDERKLPRWAVVACEGALAPAHWTPQLAPFLLGQAWALHSFERDNATLRGNLRSIGVRVAHDMRTPLGGILSAAETLKDTMADGDPSNLVWVDNIIESEAELLKLIRHQTMLTDELARSVEISEFNMGEAAASALESLEGRLTLSGSKVVKPSSWPQVRGDRRKYERIWNVLVDNAVRHGGTGRTIELGWTRFDASYEFHVSNDGPAVAAEKLTSLLRPFHRLHEPNSGRGLSLALMEELVHMQGGDSGYRLGANGNPVFHFTVPF